MYPFASPRHRLYSVFWLNKHEMILILLVAQASLKRSEDEEKFLFRTLFGSAIQQKHFNENADERKKNCKKPLEKQHRKPPLYPLSLNVILYTFFPLQIFPLVQKGSKQTESRGFDFLTRFNFKSMLLNKSWR